MTEDKFEKLKPKEIRDIVFRIEEYITEMKKMENEDSIEFRNYLEKYILDYFSNKEVDDFELKKLIVEMTDEIYIKMCNFSSRGIHVNAYFGIILNRLFWELSQRNIFIFFILDNKLTDFLFKIVVELYGASNFSVIHPYRFEKLDYSDNHTRYPVLEYKEIEKQVDKAVSQKKHILYVEKDDSVNYLNRVLDLAWEFQYREREYVCVLRNETPLENKSAIWLMGQFNNILREKKKSKSSEDVTKKKSKR